MSRTNTADLVCTRCGQTSSYGDAAMWDGEDTCRQTYDETGRGNRDGETHDWEEL